MKIIDFINDFKEKKIANTKINDHAVSDYLKKTLEIKTYIPFKTKRKVVEMVVEKDISNVDGIKKHDNIGGYITFITAMLKIHTCLEFSNDVVEDYDLLAESKLLPQIVAEFKESYDEFDALVKTAVASELEDNNVNVLIGHFLDSILKKFEGVGEMFKGALGDLDLQDLLGADIKQEDLAMLSGFLNKLK